MLPAAHIECATEALKIIENAVATRGPAADSVLKDFFKERRYAGSGDRRRVSEYVYEVLRKRGLLRWLCGEAGLTLNARSMMLAHLALQHEAGLQAFGQLPYGPAALSPSEMTAIERLKNIDQDAAPLEALWNAPLFIAQLLEGRFKDPQDNVRRALNERASVDLRVNTLHISRDELLNRLALENIAARPTPYSPQGIRLDTHVFLENHALFRAGFFELQDEGSQLVSLLASALGGQKIIDLCAGGGGKTLALASLCDGDAEIVACDVDARRLSKMMPRLDRAGVTNVRTRLLDMWGEKRSHMLADLQRWGDLVVVDAPCSGSGTWRRHPDARWRYDGKALERFVQTQDALLDEAFTLVKKGGYVAYITCSLLPQEDEERVGAALARNGSVQLVDYRDILQDLAIASLPSSAATDPRCLLLTPQDHGTDGLFIALFKHIDE